MLKNRLNSLGVIATLILPSAAIAQDSSATLPISANLTFATDYAFRGISQTQERFAVQGGFDYASEATGIYVGTWASNVDFDSETSVELDLYGGWAKSFGDFGVDVGIIHYNYPGESGLNTDEVYVGGSWKWISAKYYVNTSDSFFGALNEDGEYLSISGSYDLPIGVNIGASYGMNSFNTSSSDYDDYSLSLGYSYGGLDFGLAYVDNDIKNATGIAEERVIFSVSKSM